MKKRMAWITGFFVIIGLGIYMGRTLYVKNSGEIVQSTEISENEFASLLRKNDIYVEPQEAKMTCDQIEGMLKDVKNSGIVMQYETYLEDKDAVTMTSVDLVKLHYYSLSLYERARFLRRVSGQKITVEVGSGGDTVLISYNRRK